MRIDKLLADAGYGTRSELKKALKKGVVYVDEQQVKDPKTRVNPNQRITFKGIQVHYQEHVYLMLNKPKGVISATKDRVHQTVIDLIAKEWGHMDVFPIGRLDKDTEGLLLLTTDGGFSHDLMSPKKHVRKTYRALVEGSVTEEDIASFRQGVKLADGYVTKTAQLKVEKVDEKQSIITVEITEGKYHQVKRMFEAVGKRVIELERLQIGGLKLDQTLKRGEFRELSEEEIECTKNG
ncbi:pseudouridine synthase [Shouchella patagoniensis]|uniref:pseudouridine synthase n=1 Tax=Shouchella patagoniensis TaxID=228576 RepID=UPI0009954AAB|nr:pseudouridine synthase [Shouchella patagoniensis]